MEFKDCHQESKPQAQVLLCGDAEGVPGLACSGDSLFWTYLYIFRTYGEVWTLGRNNWKKFSNTISILNFQNPSNGINAPPMHELLNT